MVWSVAVGDLIVPEKRCQAAAVHDAGWCSSVFWVNPVESRGGKSKKHRLDGLWAGDLKHGGTSSVMALGSNAMMPPRMELKNVFGGISTTKMSPLAGAGAAAGWVFLNAFRVSKGVGLSKRGSHKISDLKSDI